MAQLVDMNRWIERITIRLGQERAEDKEIGGRWTEVKRGKIRQIQSVDGSKTDVEGPLLVRLVNASNFLLSFCPATPNK